MSNLQKTIAEAFLEMAQGLESGSFGKKPKIALTGMGSEHGEENAMKAALAGSIPSIASSSLTTAVGLLALLFLSFKI